MGAKPKIDNKYSAECIAAVTIIYYAVLVQYILKDMNSKELSVAIKIDSSGSYKIFATQAVPKDIGMMLDVHAI